ncbi:PREDICTED: disrupted in renal carcinoma protein 2 [Propithecus coquereli]|uniref:disrupted in renal carcinoma protein 2 n=1 Tax=Propithecus coquereli TaxID=379532 RepID=UPI00063F4C49|nr:PREDICTED: disrupted in renal carcinoma protein 2 [Propithecus coquereli]
MGSGWSSEEERQPLLGPGLGPAPGAAWRNREAAAAAALPAAVPGPGRVYGRRWLVLLLFSLLAFAQGLVWNTWGPIQNSARQAYGFSSWDIALLVLWGPIGFLPCFAFMWLLDKRGLRVTVLLTSFLMVLGAGLRCVPISDLTLKRRLIHGGQMLNGLAGPTVMNAAPFLSTTWFSADERATATAIASMLSYLGGACAFLVGPLVVPAPNGTSPLLASESSRAHIKDRIETVLYAGNLNGVFAGWSGVLDLILTPVHVSQVDAGWIGFWSIVGGCVVGIAMARIVTLYASCILLGVFLNSSVPIFFELFVETVYPVPEGITCGVVTFLSNMFMGVLLFFLTFYHTELSWFNWCLPGSCLLSLLLILCFRESYDRLYLDVVVSV